MKHTREKLGTGVAVVLAGLLLLAAQAGAADALSVRVSPDRAHTLPGSEVVFTVAVHNDDGTAVSADINWSVIPPRLGSIAPDGRFVAGDTSGRAIVRAHAMYGQVSGTGHAVVDVGVAPAKLTVIIEPPRATVAIDETQQFTATVTDGATGEQIDAEVRWVVFPARLGTMDGSGLFTPSGEEGAGRIAARVAIGGRESIGDVPLVVGTSQEADVVVSVTPLQEFVAPGAGVRFVALVTDQSGDPVDAEVDWLVMPARIGVIEAGGLFTAGPDEGVGRIVATVATREGPVRGLASIEIERTGPFGIGVRISPREAAVMLGGDVTFQAAAVGPDGDILDIPVDWDVRPSWIGTIDADGFLTASDEMPSPAVNGGWVGTVTASVETDAGTASDAARIFVRDVGERLRLMVRPARPVVAPGGDVQFEAVVLGGNDPPEIVTDWAVFPARLGTITPDGAFTANPAYGDPASGDFGPHDGIVTARATLQDGSMLIGRAHVRVRIPGEPVRIRVSPAVALVEPGTSASFTATVVGPNGGELELPVTWRVKPLAIGRISQDGVFTATEHHSIPPSGQRPRGLIIAEVRIPGRRIFRGGAVVVIDVQRP